MDSQATSNHPYICRVYRGPFTALVGFRTLRCLPLHALSFRRQSREGFPGGINCIHADFRLLDKSAKHIFKLRIYRAVNSLNDFHCCIVIAFTVLRPFVGLIVLSDFRHIFVTDAGIHITPDLTSTTVEFDV